MRANVRPFAREYKSRSFKAKLNSLENFVVDNKGIQTQHQPLQERNAADRMIADRQVDEIQKSAEAVFRKRELIVPHSVSTDEERRDAQPAGRILPCLLQESASSTSEESEEMARVRHRNKRSYSGKSRLASGLKSSLVIHPPVSSKGAQAVNPWSDSMSDEFFKLSDLEILSLIERARAELVRRREAGKENLRAEIKEKLKNAGLDLGDLFPGENARTRGTGKSRSDEGQNAVTPKYKNDISGETWSGRGRPPHWVKAAMEEREWTLEKFKKSDAFLIA